MLDYKVESLDGLDESIQQLYEQSGDFFTLKVEGMPKTESEDLSGLKAKVQQLMDETKAAKQKAREAEEAKAKQFEKTAQEKGEFQTLWEQAQQKLAEKDQELQDFTTRMQQKEIDVAALSVGTQLAKTDAKRASVLADYAAKYARHDGESVQFLVGGIEVDTKALMEHLKKEFPFLVDGSGATGGGAASSRSGGAAQKQISRADFDMMAPDRKMAFVKDGGVIVD